MSVSIEFSEKYFTTSEAAKMLRLEPDTVKRYCNMAPPRIKATKIGHSWMIPKSAIQEYLKTESELGRPKNARGRAG